MVLHTPLWETADTANVKHRARANVIYDMFSGTLSDFSGVKIFTLQATFVLADFLFQ